MRDYSSYLEHRTHCRVDNLPDFKPLRIERPEGRGKRGGRVRVEQSEHTDLELKWHPVWLKRIPPLKFKWTMLRPLKGD